MIRARLLLSALALPLFAPAAQQPAFDRSQVPALGTAPALTVPTVRTSRLANGAALKVVEQRELPLVHITLQFAGGGRLDNDTPGLASFVATMIREGAGARDANALQSELAYLGASLSANADWDNSTVTLRVAKRNLDAALDLMADVVLRPTFAAADVRRQRDLRLAGLLQQKDQPRSIATQAFNRAMFPAGHPYRRSLGGDSAATAALDSAMVRAFHDGAYRPLRATFTVVGDIGDAEARALLERRFGTWTVRGAERRPAPVLVSATRTPSRRLILVDKPGAAQSVIMIGAPGLERTSADYAAIQVMNTILGGSFSSRLNTNLRETKGYTYGANSGFQWRPLPGAFVASSDVRTDVTDSSLVEFFNEIRAIRDTPVSDAELARAKAYIALGIPGDLESTSQIAGQITALALFNLPLSWLQEYVTAVNAVTTADVQRVARRYVPDDAATIIVVGDLAKVRAGIEALNLGSIAIVTVEELAQP
ncbi:MAG TPA: pitrilysin family protein [Gemmatimonadaceae bacterium]|nr:pitrilysin family protein [Gemmatimonadaceae bacterium]